ncbi:MAG: hypothetical protein ACLGG0_08665 [Bacteriovoracia bacterium]
MKPILLFAIIFIKLTTTSLANPANEIKKYAKEIETTQKDIAAVLVLQNFSRFMIDASSANNIDQSLNYILSADNTQGLSQLSESFFDTIYADSTNAEKINDISKILIQVRAARHSWFALGAKTKRIYEDFYSNVANISDVCSDESFLKSMAVVESFTPAGVNTGSLRLAWDLQVGGSTSFSEGGGISFGGYANLDRNDDRSNSVNARRAAATTAGALALQFTPPPYNIAAAILLPIAIEVVWGVVDMKKNMNEMKQIAEANGELYATMRFEVNVKKHYKQLCSQFQQAYSEIQPVIKQAFDSKNYQLIYDLKKDLPVFKEEDSARIVEEFYEFSRSKLVQDAAVIAEADQAYAANWTIVNKRIDDFILNIDLALTQIIAAQYTDLDSSRGQHFAEILARVDSLSSFKKGFTDGLLKYFDFVEVDEREDQLQELKWMIEHYELAHPALNQEEIQVLITYIDVIAKLGAHHE